MLTYSAHLCTNRLFRNNGHGQSGLILNLHVKTQFIKSSEWIKITSRSRGWKPPQAGDFGYHWKGKQWSFIHFITILHFTSIVPFSASEAESSCTSFDIDTSAWDLESNGICQIWMGHWIRHRGLSVDAFYSQTLFHCHEIWCSSHRGVMITPIHVCNACMYQPWYAQIHTTNLDFLLHVSKLKNTHVALFTENSGCICQENCG